MKPFPFYTGEAQKECAQTPAQLPSFVHDSRQDARAYRADPGLVDAVNVAVVLGQPLLLTGEPGTGKTQLAYSLGCALGYEVLKFETKSTSVARDLFYTYDTLGRFHAAQLQKGTLESRDYIVYNALGIAILRSREPEEIKDWLPDNFEHGGRRRSIVLIDEVDKAPRDFPNDLLNEIEEMYFKVPELGLGNKRIQASRELRPIIVITSNSEKSLPDAFLRRCIFYSIPFPDRERLAEIVLSHMANFEGDVTPWLDEALDFFVKLREPSRGLEKRPATAELLNWLTYLRHRNADARNTLREQGEIISASLSTLFKSGADQEKALAILKEWMEEQPV